MATDKRPSLDEIFGTTTSAEKPINTVAERPSLDEIFGTSNEKKEQPKTNEWGEPVYSFEKPVEVEGAKLKDFLTPTILEQKPNAKSETELPKAINEEKPYNPEGLLPIAEPGQAEMPQSFISPKVFEEFTPEEKLMLDVDKATDNAFNAAQEEATKQMVAERKERGIFGVMNEFGEGAAEKITYRQSAGADAVIKRTFESISADDINSIIENRVANNEEFKAKKQAFDDEVKRIMPNSNDNLSDAEVEALFANMTPEEREVAEKQIADITQALEALQTRFATDVEGIYKSESKDVEAQINNRIINRLAKLNLPKNDLEYIGKAIYNNSLVGTLYEIGLNAAAGGSGTDYIVSQQALAQAKPSAIAKVVGGAGAILADGVIFGALGAGGSLAGVGVRELATKVVARQIARKAAVSATNSAVKATARRIVEKNVLQQFASSAAAQAVTLGGYNGLLTAAQETLSPTGENGAYNWRNVFHRVYEGALTGIALGGVSVGTSAARGAMYRARPDMAYTATGMAADLGISLAGFTAENAAFLGIGSIVSGEEITAEAIGESFATLGLLKGIGALKRVAKGEKLMQQPDFVQRTISDLKFTKEEMDAMRKAGIDMEAMDFISLAVTEMNNVPYTESRRSVINAYNTVMASREIPTSAKVKLKYIVTGEVPRVVGPSRAKVVEGENGIEVRTYDYQDRVVQIRPFETIESATKFVSRIQPLLERNTIVDGAKTLRGADSLIAVDRAIDEYMQTGEYFAEREKAYGGENTGSKLPAKTPLGKEALMREMRIYLGIEPGTLPEGAESRIARIVAIAKNVYQDSVSALQKQVAKQHGATVSELLHAINVKPDLRTVRESQLVKTYVDGLKQFNESMSGPVEAEQARYAEQIRPQIEQGKREVEEAERETAFVRESLNESAKRMATEDGKQIAIVRLATGEQVAVYKGRIITKENGAIDTEASENTVVIKRIDAEGNEVRNQVGIGEIAEVVEFSTPEAAVEESMSVVEAQAAKKLSLDNAIAERGEQGVAVVTIDGNSGKIVGIDENGAYILRAKGESGKEVDVPVSINDIAEINTEQPVPATTEQMAVADATEKVVEAGLATDVEVEYDDDFPPLTEEDMAPAINLDNIQWDKLSQEEYADVSAMVMGDATTLADSHIYYANSRGKLQAAQRKVAEQQKVIDKLNSRFATLSSPTEAQKLRKQVATAEQEKAKREQTVKNIEEQMAKYAYAMKKYGVEVDTENDLLAEREKLNAERAALVEADKELDQAEADAEKNIKKTIPNTEANRKYIEQLYADRFGVSPAQAGPRQAILWDLANGAIKLRWDNATTGSGAVQRGLQAELGVRGTEERRAYKAIIDNKNGQSVDAYVHDLWQNGEWGQEISTEELKDELLGVLQSTPNGSLALKELADMSGAQADLEAQISLGKGDIQRKLEEVDANLAKNAQQMADFRKRINDTVQKLESGEQLFIPVGEGEFGPIYDQFRGKPQEAVDFLLTEKNGEAIGALSHKDIGEIDLVWGKEGSGHSDGYGLSKLAKYHPEVLDKLQPILDDMQIVNRNANRVNLESPKYQAAVRLTWNNERKNWLLTAFEKRNSAIDNTTDTGETAISGKQNDTATLQSTASENKVTTTIPENQISEEEIFNTPPAPASEDLPFMIEQRPAEKPMDAAEQAFMRERVEILADVTGVKLHILNKKEFGEKLREIQSEIEAVRMSLIPKSTAPETAEQSQRTTIPTVISSADGTKILKDIDSTIDTYKNRSNRTKTFIGDVGKALGLHKTGNSQYGTFESANGEVVTIRISNHNATVSNFDNVGENNGISIVIAARPNEGVTNDGNAHIVEYFYSDIELKRADGKPLVEILKSLKQALYSGEYKDTTGLAKREEVNNPRFAIEAYHGSGADFEKFDHSFMGTGEGAQAYGHGTYVTTRKGIAENYADTIGGTIQQERRYEAQTNFLVVRKNIADENQAIEKWEKAIQQMKQTYAELESNTPFYKTRSIIEKHKKTLQELQEEIESTQALIDSSKARIEELRSLEDAADKEWRAVSAPDKIRKLNTQIELHEVNLKKQQISLAARRQRAKIKQAEYDYYKEELARIENEYGANSPEYKEYVFKNDYIESDYNDIVKYVEDSEVGVAYLEKTIADEKAELAHLKEIQKPFRNLYTVEVPDNTGDNYLSWADEIPKTQAERINNALAERNDLREEFSEADRDMMFKRDGRQAYHRLTQLLGSPKVASEFLHSLGFVGIEYPAQYTTGGRADGAKNYVIFNANDVKIVEHVRYMKTPQGVIYGFTYNGEIYIDGSELRPGVLIHEFTELWYEIVAEANPELWDEGKKLLRETDTYKEVMADPNYKNASEEAQYSETLSRITTAKAEKKMGTISDNKSLISKIRSWLRKFWGEVKSAFSKWNKKELKDLTIDQFTSMPLMDYFNGVDIRKYRKAKAQQAQENSLVGIHNISQDKLQKALKQGGLANPSAAVIDIAKQNHEGYGEYSLIMPKSLVDATSGRNAGTFTGDAWTPTYPTIVRQLDTKGWEIVKNKISTAVGDSKELYADIVNGVRNFLEDNRSSKLEYVFLKEKGIEPEIVYKGADGFVGIANLEAILGVSNITEGIEAYKRYQNAKPIYRYDFNRWASVNGNKAEFAKLKAQIKENPALKKDVDADLSFAQFDSFVNGIYKKEREAGNIDTSNTLLSASIYVDKNGLREEFESWIDTLMESAEAKEVFYAGIDRNGDRIYKPNTLENVSRHMLTEGMQNAYNNGGLSATKATLLQRLTTLSEIRQNKDRLSDEGKYNKEFDKLSDRLFNIITAISDMQEISSNRFMNIDYAELRLQDALAKRDPIAYLNKEYGYNIERDSDLAKEIKSFIGDVRRMPAKYFETKFERPVMFNEFAAVVAPDTMPESVEQQLRDAGLAIYKYNPDVEGDRRKATLAATASEDIRFMIIGEKGAVALDQAEEATTRLDNLAVAREMESDFTKRANRLEKLRTAKPIEITGNEVTPSEDLEQYRKNAREYANTLRGEYTNNDTGAVVEVNRNSIKEILHHDYKDVPHIVSVAAIPQIIEQGVYIASEKNEGNKDIDSFDYYVAGLRIGGVDYTVKSVISNRKDGSRYYDHKLTQIEKGRLLDLSAVSSTESANKTPISDIKDKRLLDILQINSKENAKKIKLATGWERGADGKWRYETQDFITRKVFTKVVNNGTAHNAYVKSEMERINKQTAWLKEIIDGLNADWVDEHIYGKSEPTLAERYPEKAQEMKDYFAQFANKDKAQKEFNRLMEYAKVVGRLGKNEYMLDEFVEDKSLFSAYPSLRNVKVVIEENRKQNYGGNWNKEKQSITIVNYKDKGLYEHTSLLHEVQHAIQDLEGFAQGGSPEIQKPDTEDAKRLREIVKRAISFVEFFQNEDIASVIRDSKKYGSLQWESIGKESQDVLLEYLGNKRKVKYEDIRKYLDNAFNMTLPRKYGKAGYKKFAGEVEARNVGIRKDMTPEERRATLLSETEDVAREDQIFLESNLGVAQSVEVSEPVEVPTRKPRKSAAEKSLEKIESLREQLKNKKRSLNDTLLDVYNFLTSKDISETMGEGVGKAQYRRVIKNSIEAIRKAYDVTDAEEKRKTIFKYLGEIDDSLSQLLTRQRLNEVTDILDKAIYGYTAQGVRTGKRIDEHTREIFDILRNAIGEPVEEERDDSGRRKPVHYRLKNRTEAGDITSSFRLRSVGSNEGIIAKLRSEADDIIASADVLDTASVSKSAQLEYTANLLSSYDNALQLNEAIGQTTDEIADIQREIERTNEQYKAAATGSEEKKNLYKMRQKLQNDLEAEQMNRAALRHRYASMLKTFTTSLEELDEKGKGDFARAEMAKAEQAVKWRRGIYKSIKNPNAPVLPREDYDRQGKEIKVNWKGLNTRAKINESAFMATFAEMSRDIDINSIPGQWAKDGWYYQFMLSEGGYMARTDWRYKQEVALREVLDAEVLKLSGDKKADEPYKLFAQLAQEPSGLVIPQLSVGKNKEGKTVGGYQDNIPLTIGQILYMRNAIRQPNGYAGYLAWGIPEEDMKKIAQYAEANYPKYCRFFDWVVSEFMSKLYEMQDAIYFEKFGTHLPKTAFYFPFVRDKRMVGKVAEVGEGEVSLPSSVTGNIVERVKTSAKMDLQADAFSVLQDHIKETLDWCAYVELTDKFNSLATSHAFGNLLKAQGVSVQKLKEMYEIAIGQGKINTTDNTTLTKTLNAISKGLVAGNIVLNLNSAAKQLVSGSCALGYTANPKIIPIWAKNFFVPSAIKTGVGKLVQQIKSGALDPVEVVNWKAFADNWKWAIENIPTLRERWEGRNVGFEVLKSHSFESWDKLSSIITKFGLAPNATIDMFTCANVAKTVYEYEYPRLLERGRSKEEAHREACVKAAIFTNETQQSGIDAFLSSFQSGAGLQRILGVGLGAYQNTSMAFARNERFALTNMLRMLNPATREQMIAHQVKAYKELGVEDKKARELAKSDFKESQGQQFSAFIHNGIVSNLLWTLAGTLLTTAISGGIAAMFGGKDEWEKMKNNEKFREELSSALSIETIAWQTPLFYNAPIFKQLLTYAYNASKGKTYGGIFESPFSQSAQELIDAIFKQWIGVKNEVTGERETKEPTRYDRSAEWLVVSTLIKAGLGVNPDLVVRMAQGIDDMMKDGVQVEDVMATLASPRGLTRAIAGEPRPDESKKEYLDRMSYIYRQVNAGSGEYDKKFVSERTKEYIDNKDNKLYRELGIVPREVRILEQRVKAIRKQLLFFDKSDEGIAEFKALSETERKQQIEIAKGYDKVFALTRKMNQGILPFDEEGMRKRKDELQQRYEMLKQVYDMWIEYNNK